MNIKHIIEQHVLWLGTDGKEGARANLEGANLRGANLAYANLRDVNLVYANLRDVNLEGANLVRTTGNLTHLKSILCGVYPVTYTAEVMQIGCQRHKLEDWWSFDDDRILVMDGEKALNWWRTWKPILQLIIMASPAIATGYVKQDNKNN